jgi:uncharacterized protein
LILYLDSSGLVKRYVREDGSDALIRAMSQADSYRMCRIGFVETARAVARAGKPGDVERVERDWARIGVIEVDVALTRQAAWLALHHGLRTLDALHLAAALAIVDDDPVFVTWDVDLHRAARVEGLRTFPASLD